MSENKLSCHVSITTAQMNPSRLEVTITVVIHTGAAGADHALLPFDGFTRPLRPRNPPGLAGFGESTLLSKRSTRQPAAVEVPLKRRNGQRVYRELIERLSRTHATAS